MSNIGTADHAKNASDSGRLTVTVERFFNGDFIEIGHLSETDAGTWRWTQTYDPSGGAQNARSGIKETQADACEALHAVHDRVVTAWQ